MNICEMCMLVCMQKKHDTKTVVIKSSAAC